MADESQKKVDKEILKVEKQINAIYGQAQKDIEDKMQDFYHSHAIKAGIYANKLAKGEITEEQYNAWYAGQMFQEKQWKAKQDQICGILANANAEATKIVNGGSISAFAEGANWTAYSLEHTAGVNFGFGLYDTRTVTRLLADNPQTLPKWKINEPKEYVWNKQKVNNCITQGIIQGENINQIAKRIATVTSNQNKNLALTHARTAMTGAQNAGRIQRLQDAKKLGINVVKEWMATLDGHTRDSHRDMDGEQQPVGDTWHPMKFSNGCRFPGDPLGPAEEVFNCRCTLVSELTDYPEEYERYDNVDGVPIEGMSYKEWEKTKQKETEPEKKLTVDDYLDAMFKEEESEEKKIEEEINKLDDQIESKEKEIEDLKQEMHDMGADKVFSGIWYNQDVTYADWESKKDSIQAKKDYYDQQIDKYQQSGQTDKVEKMEQKKAELEEFEKNGEEYSKMYKELQEKQEDLISLNKEHDVLTGEDNTFNDNAYTQERKDAALWAQTAREADDALRGYTGKVWQNASYDERRAAYNYTAGSGGFNRPLRGYDESWYNSKGVGNVSLDNEGRAKDIENLTNIIDKCELPMDTWLQRGVDDDGLAGFLGIPMNLIEGGSQEDLEKALLGKEISDPAFMSCGSSKGQGFGGNIINVYCPEGTKAIYAEPFSAFGRGDGSSWDGKSKQSNFGGEDETILQRNSYFRIIKVEKSSSGWSDRLYIDVEVIDQKPHLIRYN